MKNNIFFLFNQYIINKYSPFLNTPSFSIQPSIFKSLSIAISTFPPVAVNTSILKLLFLKPMASNWPSYSLYFSSGGLLSTGYYGNPPNPPIFAPKKAYFIKNK